MNIFVAVPKQGSSFHEKGNSAMKIVIIEFCWTIFHIDMGNVGQVFWDFRNRRTLVIGGRARQRKQGERQVWHGVNQSVSVEAGAFSFGR